TRPASKTRIIAAILVKRAPSRLPALRERYQEMAALASFTARSATCVTEAYELSEVDSRPFRSGNTRSRGVFAISCTRSETTFEPITDRVCSAHTTPAYLGHRSSAPPTGAGVSASRPVPRLTG